MHVGKTTIRKATTYLLNDITNFNIVYFFRIVDYIDELLRINPQRSSVVKLGGTDALGGSIFQSLYICINSLMKDILKCREFIGLDGCLGNIHI